MKFVKAFLKSSFAITKSAGISLISRLVACTAASQPPNDPRPSCVDNNLLPTNDDAKLLAHFAAILRKL